MSESLVKGFFLYFDQCEPLNELSDEQCGQLLRACIAKFQGEEFEITDPMVKLVFRFFEANHRRDVEKYDRKCKQMRANANAKKLAKTNSEEKAKADKSEQMQTDETKSKQMQANASKSTQQPEPELKPEPEPEQNIGVSGGQAPGPTPSRSRFVPPSLEEVDAYCRERGNMVDAQRFIDFYASKGWMVGKNKMRDWQAAVRTWERENSGGAVGGKQPPAFGSSGNSSYQPSDLASQAGW